VPSTAPRVGVVGAGLAGLTAARELARTGHRVVVFEKSRGVGGRLAARRVEGSVVDHGAPHVALHDGLRDLVEGLPADDLVRVGRPVLGEGTGPDTAGDLVSWRSGQTRLAKLMAEGLDVRLSVRLAFVRAARSGLELGDEQGNGQGVVDALVVAAPAPQAADLLAAGPEAGERVDALRAVAHHECVVALLGVALDEEPAWYGRLPPEPSPLSWLGIETAKGRPPAGGAVPVVAHLRPEASHERFDDADEDVLAAITPALVDLLGDAAAHPAWAQVKRWRFARAAGSADAAVVNPNDARIVVAGEPVAPGGLGDVHRSGLAAAAAVASRLG
jgi:hypothetical protein